MWLMILSHIIVLIELSQQINDECFCKDIINHEVKGEEIVPITVFLTEKYDIRLQIKFEDRYGAIDKDDIEIKPDKYEIMRTRNGVTNTENVNTSIPLGWVNMNITISKHMLFIIPYIDNITTEYPMQHLIIASKHLASCPQ
ncbi:unnamed protein product, partial [Meganyctiphanes norvegica]